MQVVDEQGLQAFCDGVGERRLDAALQQQLQSRTGQQWRAAQFGQHQGQLLGAHGRQRQWVRRQHGAQQPCQQGAGDAGVAGPRLHDDDPRLAGRKLLQQAALADAGLTRQQKYPARRPGVVERRAFARAADQARRAHQAGRRQRTPRRQRRGTALDGRQQLDRLGRRPCAQLVLQALLEALERGNRGRPIAAQVVQAHQAALGMFGQWVAVCMALGIDQAAHNGAFLFAAVGGRGQCGVALFAPDPPLGPHPFGHVGQLFVVEVAEQFIGSGMFVAGNALEGRCQVGVRFGR